MEQKKMSIRTGDVVKVINGKNKGQTGKVLKVSIKENKVIVEDVNIIIKHMKPEREGEAGRIVKAVGPMNRSKVMLVCPKCNKGTRVAHGYDGDGNKKRKCKKCGDLF